MQKDAPKVSVIMPAFNAEEFIDESIRSVLGQTEPNFELLIVNDGSSDDTAVKVNAFARSDKRICMFSHARARGAAAARNTALNSARGEWVAFLDADDIWAAHSLAIRLDLTQKNPNAGFISTDFVRTSRAKVISDGGFDDYKLRTLAFFRNAKPEIDCLAAAFSGEDEIALHRPVSEFLKTNLCCMDTIMVKRNYMAEISGFDTSLETGEDLHCWIRLAARTNLVFSPSVTAVYRIRRGSLTQQDHVSPVEGGAKALMMLYRSGELARYRQTLKRKMASFYQQNAYFYRNMGNRRKAFLNAVRTCRADWRYPGAWKNLAATTLGL
jgi:glycosyltransferase involved in cell wall biosynthesis